MRNLTLHVLSSFSNKQFPNHHVTRNYCVESKKFLGFFELMKWKLDCYETVPYTNRSRYIYQSDASQRKLGEKQFQEFKQRYGRKQSYRRNSIWPRTHTQTVKATEILNNIVDALQRERTKMRSASEYSFLQLLWLRLIRRSPPSMSHLDGLNWEILVVNTSDLSCQCFPGGKLTISKMWMLYFSTDEIASVIAHEVGHTVARHMAEKHSKYTWTYFVYLGLKKFISIDFNKHVWSLVLKLPFNRRLEIEADYIGLLLMAAAGYDPWAAHRVCEKLETFEVCENDSMLTRFLSTHPSGRERAEALARPKIMKEALILYNDARARCAVE